MQCMNKDSDTNESSSLNLSDAEHDLQVYVQMLANRDPWSFLLKSKGVIKVTRCYQSGPSQAGGLGGLQFLAKQLTLSQPGEQIMPTTVIQAPSRIFRPCDGPALQSETSLDCIGSGSGGPSTKGPKVL